MLLKRLLFTSPEHLSKLDIHTDEEELPLPLKKCMDETFVFRDTVKTAINGFVLSENTQITYAMISKWTKDIGVLAGFIFTVILYTLRYNSANEFDSSRAYPESRSSVYRSANHRRS
jgi:hypothetical protein